MLRLLSGIQPNHSSAGMPLIPSYLPSHSILLNRKKSEIPQAIVSSGRQCPDSRIMMAPIASAASAAMTTPTTRPNHGKIHSEWLGTRSHRRPAQQRRLD